MHEASLTWPLSFSYDLLCDSKLYKPVKAFCKRAEHFPPSIGAIE